MGNFTIRGWSGFLPLGAMFDDGVVAMTAAFSLFVIPAKNRTLKSEASFILDAGVFKKIPWSVILLFGGGFALAGGFTSSGLSAYLADRLNILQSVHPIYIVIFISLFMTFLTELTSNTASTQLLLPVLAAAALAMQIHPLMLMLPATLSASMAFMMPVATPPNAIVFSGERLKISDMAKTGFFLNLFCAAVITIFTLFIASFLFDIDPGVFPDWAKHRL